MPIRGVDAAILGQPRPCRKFEQDGTSSDILRHDFAWRDVAGDHLELASKCHSGVFSHTRQDRVNWCGRRRTLTHGESREGEQNGGDDEISHRTFLLLNVPVSRHCGDMKTDTLEVRVTPDEKLTIRTAAEREGLSLSTWVRMVVLKAAASLGLPR